MPSIRPVPRRGRALAVCALAALVTLTGVLPHAAAADPRLERAVERRLEVQARLDVLLNQIGEIEAEVSQAESDLDRLRRAEQAEIEAAELAGESFGVHIRNAYIRGPSDPGLTLLASQSPTEAIEQARLLGHLARRSRGEMEVATAARTRILVAAAEVERAAEDLAERRTQLAETEEEIGALLAEAEAEEDDVRAVIAAEEAARRAAEERARREAERIAAAERAARAEREAEEAAAAAAANPSSQPSTSSASDDSSDSGGSADPEPEPAASEPAPAAPAATPSGGVACPVGSPRNYSDTYGAPRGGGRSHMGTDILAPRGTPIYAYESGQITRMTNSRVGGISLYLRGDSGNVYFYTHLDGYVSGISEGQRVGVGQHIAINGDTGNARGIPHLHFEVMPGGGGNVNPYPFVLRACG